MSKASNIVAERAVAFVVVVVFERVEEQNARDEEEESEEDIFIVTVIGDDRADDRAAPASSPSIPRAGATERPAPRMTYRKRRHAGPEIPTRLSPSLLS